MDPSQIPGTDLVKLSDDDLGMWLVTSWLAFHAEKAGIARDAIPPEWATAIIAASATMDSDSVKNAPLESMFRKACSGDLSAAGRMLRAYLWGGAETEAMKGYANAGVKQAAGRIKAGHKTGKQKAKKAHERHTEWLNESDELIQRGRNPRDVAGILAERHGVSSSTIRRGIQSAKNKARTS